MSGTSRVEEDWIKVTDKNFFKTCDACTNRRRLILIDDVILPVFLDQRTTEMR